MTNELISVIYLLNWRSEQDKDEKMTKKKKDEVKLEFKFT